MKIPTYEYKCPLCKQDYSEVRGILEQEKKKQCDNCNVDYIRVFGTPAVTFSGSGFYATDKGKRE
jgi:putative FmdB family regulatory protein